MAGKLNITIDESGLIPLMRGVGKLEADLKDRTNGRLRDAAGMASTQLVSSLRAAASSSQTPQAALVAQSIKVRRDRLVSVAIGGRQRVGSRGTSAGAILWGSEHGGRNFDAAIGGSYWIAPAVDKFRTGPAERVIPRGSRQDSRRRGARVSGISSVIIKIGAQTAEAVSEIKKVDSALGGTQSSGKKFADGIQKAAVPAAAALTAIAGAAALCVTAAAENQQAQSKLEGQLKRSTGASTDAQKATIDHVNAMADAAAIAREDVYPAMSNLVRATGDASKAQGLLSDAMNISAATGKPLGSVSAALGKAYNGSYGALKKLVPTLSDAATSSKDFHQAQKELNKQFAGAAKGDAETAAGQYREVHN